MIKALLCAVTLCLTGAGLRADPVVVELYTSQGCSSCPPADALLAQMAERTDVLALSLHVDYWDYIGWKDPFAKPQFTKRQRRYARASGDKMVYTPQMVIGGTHKVVGSHPGQVSKAVAEARRPAEVEIEVAGDRVVLRRPMEAQAMEVHVVRFDPLRQTEIKRGENAGRRLSYVNVVTSWQTVSRWSGSRDLALDIPVGEGGVAVIVQRDGMGPVLGCARLR